MENTRSLKQVLKAMILVNWFILIYYVIVCSASKSVICDMNLAYAFLWRSGGLPKKTVTLSVEVFGLYGLLCVLIFNKESVYRRSLSLRVLICAAEIILSAALVWSLNYYYSGIALLVLADLLWHEQKKETRVFFIIVQVLEFVIGNDEILSYFQSNISFAQYLSNFRPAVRSWLIGVDFPQRRTFIEDFFGVLQASGAMTLTDLRDLGIKGVNAMLGRLEKVAPETKKTIWALVVSLLSHYTDKVTEAAGASLKEWINASANQIVDQLDLLAETNLGEELMKWLGKKGNQDP